jgi:hypothetical protein
LDFASLLRGERARLAPLRRPMPPRLLPPLMLPQFAPARQPRGPVGATRILEQARPARQQRPDGSKAREAASLMLRKR